MPHFANCCSNTSRLTASPAVSDKVSILVNRASFGSPSGKSPSAKNFSYHLTHRLPQTILKFLACCHPWHPALHNLSADRIRRPKFTPPFVNTKHATAQSAMCAPAQTCREIGFDTYGVARYPSPHTASNKAPDRSHPSFPALATRTRRCRVVRPLPTSSESRPAVRFFAGHERSAAHGPGAARDPHPGSFGT